MQLSIMKLIFLILLVTILRVSARVAICDSHKDCEPGQYCLQWPPGSWVT